jgi:hypothetical protein
MKEKTTIEDLFAQYQPDMGNSREYLEQISKKLEAAEYAKRYREAQTRRYRRMMVAVFISGIVTGAIGIVLILLKPLWLFPSGITIKAPASFPMLPKMLLLLIICFVSVCITGLVRKISDSREVRVR